MKRVIYQAIATNGTNALNRAAHAYCKRFKGVEFPQSADFSLFLKDFAQRIESLNKKYPKCTPLAVKAGASGTTINVIIPTRVDSYVVRLHICLVTATYTAEYGYVDEIKIVNKGGGKV